MEDLEEIELIKENINVKKLDNGNMEFSFSFYEVFKGVGTYCDENGRLTFTTTICGVPTQGVTVDLQQKDFTRTQYFGVGEIMHGFYLKDSCLWMKGHIKKGNKIKEWDKKIGL